MLDLVDIAAYQNLPAFRVLKDVVRRWWGLELALTDAKGYCADHAQGQVVPSRNDFCRDSLHAKEGFRRCNESVQEIAARFQSGNAASLVAPCHLGFDVVAAPVRHEGTTLGMTFVGGSVHELPSSSQREDLGRRLRVIAPEGSCDVDQGALPVVAGDDLKRLKDLVEQAARVVEDAVARSAPRSSLGKSGARAEYAGLIGSAPSMERIYALLDKVTDSDATVLINGESGTGKELVARAIHYGGPRAEQPFVVQNCSAFQDSLLESTLFGHAKGAFTGAVGNQRGLFEVADKGTFFLDEIGDMSPALQVKILRVLQEGVFFPVGSTEARQVDVRVIAATHKDLNRLVAEGRFREDLYYRIHVIRITMPALRERLSDLPLLVDFFLNKHQRKHGRPPKISPEVMEVLGRYAWPGNVRELENEIERLLVLGADLDELPVSLLSPRMREGGDGARSGRFQLPHAQAATAGSPVTLKEAVESLEKELISQGLIRTHWNKSQLAKDLGISRSNLIQKCAHYGLDRREDG